MEARGVVKFLGEGAGKVQALKGVDLTLHSGELALLMGPSGSGKTTLFKLLGAAEPLQQGEILLNDIPWANLTVDEIRRHAAQMRQGDILLHGSIADNVSLFAAHGTGCGAARHICARHPRYEHDLWRCNATRD